MNQLTKILLEDILEIKNQDYIIYFDIDDTLTDYSNRLGSMIITDPETGEKRPIKASDTVDNIEFWTSAKWIPGSQQMLDFAKNNFSNVEILSAVPELSKANKELTGKRFFDDPIDGKTEWLNKNVGPIKTIWTKSGKEKAIYATPNTVLVDDKPENIKAFEQAGGIGILMDNPQNVINKLSDLLEGKNMVQEGIIDNMKAKIKDFISAIKQEGKETRDAFKLILQSAKGDITLTDEQKEQIGNQLKDVLKTIGLTAIAVLPGGVIVATLLKIFKQTHLITPSAFVNEVGEASLKPYKWEEVDQEGYFVYTRFITDSETQYDVDIKTTVFFPAGQMESLPALEIEFTAKPKGAEGSSAKIVVNKGEMYRVMATIVDIIKKYLKKSKAQAIIYSPSKKSSEENFGVQRDQLYRAFISKAIPGVTFKQSGDFVTAILPNPINEIVTDTEVICDNCGWEWPIADGGDDLYICHKCGHDNNPDLEEGTCGYDTDVKTGKKLDTPGGLEEGRPKKKDPKKGTGKKPEGSGRRLYTDEDPKDTVRIKFKTKEDIVDTLNKKQFKAKSHARQSQVINLIHQRVRAAYGKAKDPEVKARLKRALDYIESRKESSKEKTERLRKMKEASDPQAGTALPYGSGFAPIKENDPFGLNEIARNFAKEVLKQTLNEDTSEVQTKKININFELWTGRKISEDIILAMSPDSQGLFELGDNIEKSTGLSLKDAKKYNESPDDAYIYGLVNTMNDGQDIFFFNNGTRLAGKAKELGAWPAVIEQLAHEGLHLARAILAKSLMGDKFPTGEWPSMGEQDNDAIEEEELTTSVSFVIEQIAPSFIKMAEKYIPELKLPSIQENKLFSLNKSIKQFLKEALIETWNPEESFVSLSKYMIDNGMNIKPLPKIKVIKDDEENASDLLGKTAYYDPNEKSITLFTMNRHPKDILRSFAHEMIHHEQNLNGKLKNITTTNTNEDGDLPEIEREAYEKGNMMLRNWEDKIKNV
jgi:hypothetical protein